jgi:plasmid stabilization system protein ParE
MNRHVEVDLELSHFSEENGWAVSATEKYVQELESEVERLRDQCNHLVEKFKSDIEVSYEKRNSAEQERDQLKARVIELEECVRNGN